MQTQSPVQNDKGTWQQDYRHALRTIREVNSFFEIELPEDLQYDFLLPINLAKKILKEGMNSPRGIQFLPSSAEFANSGKLDPIGDKKNMIDGGIIHRYKNRILFTPTSNCPVICRYCFRKNELSHESNIFNSNLKKLSDYLLKAPEVNEVILTGGDPLVLSNSKLRTILETLYKSNIAYLRFHTRTPVILPNRIDEGLVSLLEEFQDKFTRINFVLHTNHADEIDKDVEKALLKLKTLRVKKLTQSVLLRGVNDNDKSLKDLFFKIVEVDFTPYYLHHPDQVKGGMHFYLPLEEGRRIYAKLRDELPGWAIPTYIIDNSEGRGKQFAFNPETFTYSGKMLNISGSFSEY